MFRSYRNMTKPQGATSTNTNKVPQGQQQQQAWKLFWQKGQQAVQGGNPSPKHDPNAMGVDRMRWPPLVCIKCRKPGHMAQDCRPYLDLHAMNYKQIMAYPKEKMAEEIKKDLPSGDK